jgi:hypothetical protein
MSALTETIAPLSPNAVIVFACAATSITAYPASKMLWMAKTLDGPAELDAYAKAQNYPAYHGFNVRDRTIYLPGGKSEKASFEYCRRLVELPSRIPQEVKDAISKQTIRVGRAPKPATTEQPDTQ